MSKFAKSRFRPLTPEQEVQSLTAAEMLERGNHWANVASVAAREAAFLSRKSRQRKRAEAQVA